MWTLNIGFDAHVDFHLRSVRRAESGYGRSTGCVTNRLFTPPEKRRVRRLIVRFMTARAATSSYVYSFQPLFPYFLAIFPFTAPLPEYLCHFERWKRNKAQSQRTDFVPDCNMCIYKCAEESEVHVRESPCVTSYPSTNYKLIENDTRFAHFPIARDTYEKRVLRTFPAFAIDANDRLKRSRDYMDGIHAEFRMGNSIFVVPRDDKLSQFWTMREC